MAPVFEGPAGQTKAARSGGGCSDFLLQFLQIERDPPTASELSKLKYQ
jgi:hypothetical protein